MFGLDKEIAARMEAKRDKGLEAKCCDWVRQVSGLPFQATTGEELIPVLKDGVILCEAMNKVQPGAIRRINKSRMPFKQMENISNFIKACRKIGVAEHALFTTADLYERGNIGNVINGIMGFSSAASKINPKVPTFGAKLATSRKVDPKQWAGKEHFGVSKLMEGSSRTMERTKLDVSNNIAFGKEMLGDSLGGTSRLMEGSSRTMERSHIDKTNDIAFGKQMLGDSRSAGVTTKLMEGSSKIMGRSHIDQTNDISFGSKFGGGLGRTGASTKLMQGSSKIMGRSHIDQSNDIGFGAKHGGGLGRSGIATKVMEGSRNVMQRSAIDRTNDVAFGANVSGPGRSVLNRASAVPPPPPARRDGPPPLPPRRR